MKPLFGGFCDAPRRCRIPMENGFFDAPHVVAYRWMVVLSMGDGNPMAKATAEGRLYNHSPRLACLPGVSCEKINLPPKSGCINHGKYFSKLSQRPAIGSGVPPAREMGRMRSAYRVTEKSRRSATMPMWRWHFYNRSSAVVACAAGVTG